MHVRSWGIYLPYSEPDRVFKHSAKDKHTSEAGALEFLFSAIKPFTLRVMGAVSLLVGGSPIPQLVSVTLGRNLKGLSGDLLDRIPCEPWSV